MKDINITIIGGGSKQWALQFLRDTTLYKGLGGNITLHDIDNAAAIRNIDVAKRIFALNKTENKFTVSAEPNLEKSLKNCDLVIISIEPGLMTCREGDLLEPEKYGIFQSVGDTTGPGGIFRAKRAVPLFLNFGKAIKENCPDAWVINYTNPMTLCTAALYKAFPEIKAMGCCHEVFHLQTFIAGKAQEWLNVEKIDRREINIDITGVNHFTFITKASYKGIDLMPRIKELANSDIYKDYTALAKERIENEKWFDSDHLIALDFLKNFGSLGAAGDRHLAEFVPWYLTSDETLNKYGVVRTPYEWRLARDNRRKNEPITDEDLIAKPSDEEGVDIMMSLFGERTLYTNINLPNRGQINYLPLGSIVESNGYITENSIVPSHSNNPTEAVKALIKRVNVVQELTLEAICNNDDEMLFQAFLQDPLMTISVEKARELFNRMNEICKIKY